MAQVQPLRIEDKIMEIVELKSKDIDINILKFIPEEIAKELTVPETVNKNNIGKLKEIINNGPIKHPGSNYVIRPDGIRKKITEENKKDISDFEMDEMFL